MSSKRRVYVEFVRAATCVAAAVAFSGIWGVAGDLDCTNNLNDRITCHLDQANCTEYSLEIRSVELPDDEGRCTLQQCDNGQCCCSASMPMIYLDSHTVAVRRRGRTVESKTFDVKESMKPETPTIISVNESSGGIEVLWQTNMEESASDSLKTEITYYKKGDVKKERFLVKNTKVNGQCYYEIPRQRLEMGATYVVSVRSVTNWSSKFSDGSREWECQTHFTASTGDSSDSLLLAIIVSLSVAAVILSGAMYVCFVRLKTKWWDSVRECPIPKFDIVHSTKQEILKPVPPVMSSIYVDLFILDDGKPWSKTSSMDSSSGSLQQSSSISTGSSCISYVNTEPDHIKAGVQSALCKAFPNISPMSLLMSTPLIETNQDNGFLSVPISPCGGPADCASCGSPGLMNKTYSILLPHPIVVDHPAIQRETEVLSSLVHHPSQRDVVDEHQRPFPLVPASGVSSLLPTDMSYRQCNQGSGRTSEEPALPLISSTTDTARPSHAGSSDPGSRVDLWREKLVESETKLDGISWERVTSDKNLCQAPAKSQSWLVVDDGYQAFKDLVGGPGASLSEQQSGGPAESQHSCQRESPAEIQQNPQSTAAPAFSGCGPNSHTPFLPFWSANQSASVIVDCDYQSV